MILVLAASGAKAHLTHDQERVFVATSDGRTVFLRMPLPFAFADEIAAARETRRPLASPYLRRELSGTAARYRVLAEAIDADEAAFRSRLSALFAFDRGGTPVEAAASAFRLHPRAPRTAFGSVSSAQASVATESTPLDVVFSDSVVEIRFDLSAGTGSLGLRRSGSGLALPDGVDVVNWLVVDAPGSSLSTVAVEGQLSERAAFPPLTERQTISWSWLALVVVLALVFVLAILRIRARTSLGPRP
ncbi:hypothetical protein [Jannaschia sp. LMIT008]|uniref:hypothetical protein n=1 Tax=Jannaschia maritima TaxID=3032585 RepID=UPI002811351A|nr:hypothetical protein [Jannaschia sp. LMIT008]